MLTPRLIYSTFRIKPCLVQIHQNVVLFLFDPPSRTTTCTIIQRSARSFFISLKKKRPKLADMAYSLLKLHPHIHTDTHACTRILISSVFPGSLSILAALFQVNPTHKEVLSAVKVQGHKPYKITPTPPRHVVQHKRIMHYQRCFSHLKLKIKKNP